MPSTPFAKRAPAISAIPTMISDWMIIVIVCCVTRPAISAPRLIGEREQAVRDAPVQILEQAHPGPAGREERGHDHDSRRDVRRCSPRCRSPAGLPPTGTARRTGAARSPAARGDTAIHQGWRQSWRRCVSGHVARCVRALIIASSSIILLIGLAEPPSRVAQVHVIERGASHGHRRDCSLHASQASASTAGTARAPSSARARSTLPSIVTSRRPAQPVEPGARAVQLGLELHLDRVAVQLALKRVGRSARHHSAAIDDREVRREPVGLLQVVRRLATP